MLGTFFLKTVFVVIAHFKNLKQLSQFEIIEVLVEFILAWIKINFELYFRQAHHLRQFASVAC
jgi:hypothetical protein